MSRKNLFDLSEDSLFIATTFKEKWLNARMLRHKGLIASKKAFCLILIHLPDSQNRKSIFKECIQHIGFNFFFP